MLNSPPITADDWAEYLLDKSSEGITYATPDGIVRFAREVIGITLKPYQEEILHDFVLYRRYAGRAPHGVGKTTTMAVAVLWGIGAFQDDVKVVTTASAYRQVIHFLWPEIKKWAAKTDWSKVGMQVRRGKELLEYNIKLPGKEAFASVSDDPALIEGAHATHLIYIFDEAKAIPTATWDAVEGAFSTGDCYWLAMSTPGEPSGRFYDIHKRKAGLNDWHTKHVTLQEAIDCGQINPDWAAQRAQQWGTQSAVYQNRVEGEFAESGDDAIIPLSWAEKAVDRWHECGGKGEGNTVYGVDPAYKGDDKTTIARLVGNVVEDIEAHSKEDTMQTAGRVAAKLKPDTPCGVDVIGIGAGVYDRLKELGYKKTFPVNVAETAAHRNKPITDSSGELEFENLRAAIWWMLREALDPTNPDALAIPPDSEDRLIGDLTAPAYGYSSRGKVKVESKDDIKKRIGVSTDYADAVGLAVYMAWLESRSKGLPTDRLRALYEGKRGG